MRFQDHASQVGARGALACVTHRTLCLFGLGGRLGGRCGSRTTPARWVKQSSCICDSCMCACVGSWWQACRADRPTQPTGPQVLEESAEETSALATSVLLARHFLPGVRITEAQVRGWARGQAHTRAAGPSACAVKPDVLRRSD